MTNAQPPPAHDVSAVLQRVEAGDAQALPRLLEAVYDELRAMAQAQLNHEGVGHTLQATALVHEAYLKLVNQQAARWEGRAHFFASAAQAMRRILVDHARGKQRLKRGGGLGGGERIGLSEIALLAGVETVDLVALDDALRRLAAIDPVAARTVDMRYFAGMEVNEIALVLGITVRTVNRHWVYAKAWLFRELGDRASHGEPDASRVGA